MKMALLILTVAMEWGFDPANEARFVERSGAQQLPLVSGNYPRKAIEAEARRRFFARWP